MGQKVRKNALKDYFEHQKNSAEKRKREIKSKKNKKLWKKIKPF